MTFIICNANQERFYKRLAAATNLDDDRVDYALNRNDLAGLCALDHGSRMVLIDVALVWDGNSFQDFYGFDIASDLRSEYSVKAPMVFISFLTREFFEERVPIDPKFNFLKAAGSSILSFPFPAGHLHRKRSNARPLSESELRDVVFGYCGVREKWRLTSHLLSGYLATGTESSKPIKQIMAKWAPLIIHFAPDQVSNLEELQDLLASFPASGHLFEVKRALQNLDEGLQNSSRFDNVLTLTVDQNLPKRPPNGFSKLLIADDESQHFLINSLRNQFGYNVIDQAFKLSEAKELLDREKPDVVLSDYYFKESSRKTEVPSKTVGDSFIHYALTSPQYSNTQPKKPIVLVTSKATLRTETDIRVGAINCSGALRATDPLFIHGLIWSEARRRGVSKPEEILGQQWTLEDTCRQRVEQFGQALPRLIKQWGEFKGTVRDTLRLCRLLYESASNDDPEIVQQTIRVLEAYEGENNFSLASVVKIFAQTESIHRDALSPPNSAAKQAIRNILHGKIEQFSSVSNAAKFLLSTLPHVGRDLVSLPDHKQVGQKLLEALKEHSDFQPLLPLLILIDEILAKALSSLREPPFSPTSSRSLRVEIESNSITIVVVEDNEYWRDCIISAIKKVKKILGENFNISYQHFDNAAEALASIPSTSKSFAIDGSHENETKVIAIVDICLPENKEHAERIRDALEGRSQQLATPSSTHGLNLIRTLSSYNYNVPLIVYSTIDSIGDRRTIGAWGVSDDDFLAKGIDGDDAIVRALIRKIEKPVKYVIRRFEEENGDSKFWINGLGIPFTKELGRTFAALYSLRQTTGRKEFSVTEIANARGDSASEESKNVIQDQMYRIRSLILETLQSNRVYVNVRELIRTRKSPSDEYTYQLNAEVMPLGEEEDYETDLQQFESDVCRVLVIENNPQTLGEIIEPLESLGYEVRYATNVEDAVRAAMDFLPHVISLDLQIPRTRVEAESPDEIGEELAGLDAWKQIRTTLSSNTIGIVVPTVNADKNHLVAKAAQMEIPVRNFVSKLAPNWHSLLLKKVADENRRVFLGEVTDARQDINEPIVEILDGSDLSEGVLRLIVNSEPFTMKKSPLAKIIGLLLTKPGTLLSFETIKTALDSGAPVTKDDSKNWTKRIRGVIKKEWLKSSQEEQDLTKTILESSAHGLRLNVHVIDSRGR